MLTEKQVDKQFVEFFLGQIRHIITDKMISDDRFFNTIIRLKQTCSIEIANKYMSEICDMMGCDDTFINQCVIKYHRKN